jgi:hypothetical protein
LADARTEVAVLEAKLEGDARRAAEIRLDSARAELGVKRQLYEAGQVSRAELVAAETAVQLREIERQRLEDSGSLPARIQSLEPEATAPTQPLVESNDAARVSELVEEADRGPTTLYTKRVFRTPKSLFLVATLIFIGLFGFPALVGGAVWWIIAGRRTGNVIGRTALTLAIGGPLFTVAVCLVLSQVGILVSFLSLPLLLVCEIPAFCLGVMCRQTGLGKTAIIVSITLIVLSVVLTA